MREEKDKPAIRFEGFTDAWEQRKFGELYEQVTQKNDLTYGIDRNITVATMQFKSEIRVTEEDYLRTYNVFLLGDIAFEGHQSKEFRYGRFVENDIGNGIVSHIFAVFRPKMKYDLQFWKYAINNERLMQPVLSRCTKASTMMNDLVATDFLAETFLVPCVEEQQLIGAFISQLDNLITLHQRKYEKLVTIKKSCLEKMFPQNGSLYPEVRFSGYTDPWEQRKLSEVADKVTEKNLDLAVQETFTNSAEFGIISQRDFFDHSISNADNIGGYYVVRGEDFVYNPRISVTAPVGPINRNKLGRNGVMSPLYTVFRPHDIDATYLEWFFKSSYWHPFMLVNGDSGARSDRFSIKNAVFFEMPIPAPSLEEQRRIGSYLDRLDNIITLHQRELEKLRNLKKSLLQQMFV